MIEALIEHGADALLLANQETPIHVAAKAGNTSLLEFFDGLWTTKCLLRGNPRKNELHSALAGDPNYVIRWLVENGADINATYSTGETPLDIATRQGNETAVRVLLELGATVVGNVPSTWEIVPHRNILVQAAKTLNMSILRMLLENVEKNPQASHFSSKRVLIVQALLDAREGGSDEAAELLEQTLESFEEMCRERSFLDLDDVE